MGESRGERKRKKKKEKDKERERYMVLSNRRGLMRRSSRFPSNLIVIFVI